MFLLLIGAIAHANQAPVALAGAAFMAYPGDTVILDGSGSYDPDGDEIDFRWSLVSGPAATLTHGDGAHPEIIAEDPGTYHFELTVDDGALVSEPDAVDVIVVDPAIGDRLPAASGGCSAAPRRAWVGLGWLAALAMVATRRRRA